MLTTLTLSVPWTRYHSCKANCMQDGISSDFLLSAAVININKIEPFNFWLDWQIQIHYKIILEQVVFLVRAHVTYIAHGVLCYLSSSLDRSIDMFSRLSCTTVGNKRCLLSWYSHGLTWKQQAWGCIQTGRWGQRVTRGREEVPVLSEDVPKQRSAEIVWNRGILLKNVVSHLFNLPHMLLPHFSPSNLHLGFWVSEQQAKAM